MYTLEDYLNFRGDISFDIVPVNEVDEMIFASMGKSDFSGLDEQERSGSYSEVFNNFYTKFGLTENSSFGLLQSPIMVKILHCIALCPRYSEVQISDFANRVNEKAVEQFSALTVHSPGGKIYVTFRGTDDTLIGWKENGELAIKDAVPAQNDALEYLEDIADKYDGPIVVLGHSKGGNMAVYAAVNAGEEIQDRIEKVVSYDGPGFRAQFLEKPEYIRIKDKITTMVPTASIVGMTLHYAGSMDVIECEKEGAAAHDIFFWNVNRDGFVRADGLSEKSRQFSRAISQTLDNMNGSEMQELVNEFYEVFSYTGAVKLTELTEQKLTQAFKIAGKFSKAKEIRQFIIALSRFYIEDSVSSTLDGLKNKFKDIMPK